MTINADIASSSISQKSAAPQYASGKITFDSSLASTTDFAVVNLGFTPRYVEWANTTGITGEWYEGMAADSCFLTIANGTRALSTTGSNGGITVCDSYDSVALTGGAANTTGNAFKVIQNATLALITADDVVYWRAHG